MSRLLRQNLETPRMQLKPYSVRMAEEVFALIQRNKPRLLHSFPQLLKSTETTEATKEYVQQKIFDWNRHRAYAFLIFLRDTDQLIGHLNIKDIDWKRGQAEISYFIDAVHENKGLISEAIQQVLHLLFSVLPMNTITARIVTDNLNSQRVVEKNGLKYEGTFYKDYLTYDNRIVDTYRYGISKSEFERLQSK